MLDVSPHIAPQQRVHGRAAVVIGSDGRIADLHQSGAAKAMLPRMHGRPPEVVFLNTAGGVTGGDRLSYALEVAAGATVVGTTQTAERAYRSSAGTGRIETRLTVGAGATLAWLPQEVIVFEGARLDRVLEADLDATARLITCETLVLGRRAMGEHLRDIGLTDRRRVRRAGRVIGHEAIGLDARALSSGAPAGLGPATALATVCLFASDAPDQLDRVQAALPPGPAKGLPGLRAAASAWDGRLVVRLMGADAHDLRRALARIVTTLTAADLPRVWQT